MRVYLKILLGIILLLLSGCASNKLSSQSIAETAATVAIVSVGATAISVKEAPISTPMSIGIVPTSWAKELSLTELQQEMHERNNFKFPPTWYYMGSDQQYHFVLGFFFADARQLYKIPRHTCHVEPEQTVTTNQNLWFKFNRLSTEPNTSTCFIWQERTRSHQLNALPNNLFGTHGNPYKIQLNNTLDWFQPIPTLTPYP